MTVTNENRSVTYNGDGSTTVFPVANDGVIYFLQPTDLLVTLIDADGTEHVQALTTNYTVAGAGEQTGGSVTMLVAPAVGKKLRIERIVNILQPTNYPENTKFPAKSHERALDRLTMIDQQQQAELDRAPKFPVGSGLKDIQIDVPGSGKLLGWSADGKSIVPSETTVDERTQRIAADEAERAARIAADTQERNERIRADAQERTERIQGDKAFASLISQAGPIEVPVYDSALAVSFANIKATIQSIRTGGYAEAGDGGGALYKRVAAEPSHAGKIQSADGAWWELVASNVNAKMFGAVGDGAADDTVATQNAISYAKAFGAEIYLDGTFKTTASLTDLYNVRFKGPGRISREGGSSWYGSPTRAVDHVIYVSPNGNAANDGLGPAQPVTTERAAEILAQYHDLDVQWTISHARGVYRNFVLPDLINGNQDQAIRIWGIDPGHRSQWGAGLTADGLGVKTTRTVNVPINGQVYTIQPGTCALGPGNVSAGLFRYCRIETDQFGNFIRVWGASSYNTRREAILGAWAESLLPTANRAHIGFLVVQAGATSWVAGTHTLAEAASVYYYDVATKHEVFYSGYDNPDVMNGIMVGRDNFVHVAHMAILGYGAVNQANAIGLTADPGTRVQVERCKFWANYYAGLELNFCLSSRVVQNEFGKCGRGIYNYSFSQMSLGSGAVDYLDGNEIMGSLSAGGLYLKNGGHIVGGATTFAYNDVAVNSDRQGTFDARGDRYIGNRIVFGGENLKYTETISQPDDFDFQGGVSSNVRIYAPEKGSTFDHLVIGTSESFKRTLGRLTLTGSTALTAIASRNLPANLMGDRDVAFLRFAISGVFNHSTTGNTTFRFRLGGANDTLTPQFSGSQVFWLQWTVYPTGLTTQTTVLEWRVSNAPGFSLGTAAGIASVDTAFDLTSAFTPILYAALNNAASQLKILSSEVELALKAV